jgi:hypothetical protein
VHSASKAELVGYLEALRERGDAMSMLFMTVRTTSHGMIAGVIPGRSLVLDYVHGPWRSLRDSIRFSLFCRSRKLQSTWETWGKEKVSRCLLGQDSENAADTIDACFDRMFDQRGPYAIDFRPFGWRSSNSQA